VSTHDSLSKLLAEAMQADETFEEFAEQGIFYSLRPSEPTRCITIYDDGGFIDGREMDGRTIVFPGIQFIVRDSDPNEAYRLAKLIWNWTETILPSNPVTLGDSGLSLKSIKKTTTILAMGIEDKTLAQLYSINVQLTISGD
jgi:hypothetical protein